MSLETPISVRILQRKLYRKAKQEPNFRFYLLYDKIYREDILNHAYELVKANKGAPGVDGQTFEQIELQGRPEWLEGIRKDLHDKTYQPQPVRRVMIPKPGGGERPLGIPTIRDRTVQTAVKLVLEPIFESDLEPDAYGYWSGPQRRTLMMRWSEWLCRGFGSTLGWLRAAYFSGLPTAVRGSSTLPCEAETSSCRLNTAAGGRFPGAHSLPLHAKRRFADNRREVG
jgi:RNA-directed DNA polymerase